jgi:hypothetical protein
MPLSGPHQAIAVSEALVGFGTLVPFRDYTITELGFRTLLTEGGALRLELETD